MAEEARLFCPWGFSGQEYWSGLLFPPPGDLPNPEIEPTPLLSPSLAGGLLTTSATWKALIHCVWAQLGPTLCDPMDGSPRGTSVHGIPQARTLEWVAISYSRGSSWPGDRTECRVSPAFAGGYFLTTFPIQAMGNHKKTCRRKLKMVFM